MHSRLRYAEAVASMSPEQLWALKVTIMAERRLKTHYQAGQINGYHAGPLTMAYEWALNNVTDIDTFK